MVIQRIARMDSCEGAIHEATREWRCELWVYDIFAWSIAFLRPTVLRRKEESDSRAHRAHADTTWLGDMVYGRRFAEICEAQDIYHPLARLYQAGPFADTKYHAKEIRIENGSASAKRTILATVHSKRICPKVPAP